MARGDQSKALRIMSKQKGWDPTQIEGGGSIAGFDVAPGVSGGAVGRLPGCTPDGWPGSLGVPSIGPESVGFSHPDATRETKSRATRNADPNPGKPGA
jgi:hypothetical protein